MPLKYKKPNYNETLSNIVNGLEEKVSGRAASVLRQPIRNLQTTIQVLDNDGSIIDTITGKTTGGTINYDPNSGSIKINGVTRKLFRKENSRFFCIIIN